MRSEPRKTRRLGRFFLTATVVALSIAMVRGWLPPNAPRLAPMALAAVSIQSEPPPRVEPELGKPGHVPQFEWGQTDSPGPWKVTVELTSPYMTLAKREVTIRRFMTQDCCGMTTPHVNLHGMYSCGTSHNGGPRCGGWTDLDDAGAGAIDISLNYSWSIPRDHVGGKIDERVKVGIGESTEVDFDDGCHLSVTWQRNENVPDEPTADTYRELADADDGLAEE